MRRSEIVREVVGLYVLTLLFIKLVVFLQERLQLVSDVLVLVPLLFLAVPVLFLERRGEDPADYGLVVERSHVLPALWLNVKVFAIVLPVFLLANHMYQGVVMGKGPLGRFPHNYWTEVVAYHLFFVAFPEEFFYRGYVQGRLGRVFDKPWRVFGVSLGPAFLLTTLMFTMGHSIVMLRWWHFAIFFPSLLFGWLKEKSGNVLPGAMCHACCNILMVTLETWYGVIPV